MQRMKRAMAWLMMGLLVLSLLPPGLARQAHAAGATATYFIPDIVEFGNTSKLIITGDTSDPTFLSRSNVYTTNSGAFTVKGTFTNVARDSLKVKIEQLNTDPTGWVPDKTRVVTGTVLADTSSTSRFTANNLALFNGFNRITFSGMQGGLERSDTFYVLFDQAPYLQSMKVSGGGITTSLSEGSPVVVESSSVTVQGVAKNVTGMSVSTNGGTAVVGSVMDDGSFYSPALALQTGLNDLTITIKNASDSVTITRSVYFYDKTKPFTDVTLIHDAVETQLLNKNAVVTSGSGTSGNQATLRLKMLVKYDENVPFDGNATFSINDSTPPTVINLVDPTTDEQIIPGTDGVTPAYRLVTFETDPFDFKQDTLGVDVKNQSFKLAIAYNGVTITYNGKFTFLPGEAVIKNMYYLPNFDEATFSGDFSTVTKLPLNNAEVNSDTFYVLVETDDSGGQGLAAEYLPLGTAIDPSSITAGPSDGTNLFAFQISGFKTGQQQVRFHFDASTAPYVANINYTSKDYIYVADLYDGQTYEFDSRLNGNQLKVSGQYVGFKNLTYAQYFVNGITPASPALGVSDGALDFDLTLDISDTGPLYFGENRIVFVGKTDAGGGIVREIRKEIRVYIVDKNVSTITKFMPTIAPDLDTDRQAFPGPDVTDTNVYTDLIKSKIFAVTPEFLWKDSRYVTSRLKYDLVIEGGGASSLSLRLGTDTFMGNSVIAVPDAGSPDQLSGTFTYNLKDYDYEFAGDQDHFILRIKNIDFTVPGSHVYILELVNATGARTTQRLEVVREVSAYRILSPQPTVGNDIIVNKNFVRFDVEAEGATDVLINGKSSTKRTDVDNRFVYDFVGLKPDKLTAIKLQIVRPQGNINDTINVYYTSAVQVDSQYMQAMAAKLTVFNKTVELAFPKGTVLKSAKPDALGITKFYKDNQLLFGIADPSTGIVEKRNDYGNIINRDADGRSNGGATTISIPDINVQRFNSTEVTGKFTRVSPVYWINGGWGEEGDKDTPLYMPSLNGTAPYFIEGNTVRSFADPTSPIPQERKIVPSNRGTLKLTFNSNVVDDASYTITVFRFTDDGVWENVGGEVDMKKHTITVPFDEFGYFMVGKMKSGYSDITNHPWARNMLNGLYSKGIMPNVRFDEFGADDQTTRGEFATLLVKGLNIQLNYDDNQTFSDVVPGSRSATWDYEHIETAARAGIVSGISDGAFGPDLKITREDAAVMIARALKLKLAVNDAKLEAALGKSFVDGASVQFYAKPSVQAVTKAGVMSGSSVTIPGQKKPMFNFNPKSNLTRAEAGSITVKLLQKYTKIFPKTFN